MSAVEGEGEGRGGLGGKGGMLEGRKGRDRRSWRDQCGGRGSVRERMR